MYDALNVFLWIILVIVGIERDLHTARDQDRSRVMEKGADEK